MGILLVAKTQAQAQDWILCRGGCSGSGVQWMGVVLCSKLVYNVI